MIFDIYEQSDLFQISGCARQPTLVEWLTAHRIPFITNAKGRILAHKTAVDAGLGVLSAANSAQEEKVELGYATETKQRKRQPS